MKGILKDLTERDLSPSETRKGHRLHWDENNLQQTEAMRTAVTMKICEPKTPFVYLTKEQANDLAEGDDQMPALRLDDELRRNSASDSDWSIARKGEGADWESSEDELGLSPEARAHRQHFRELRKRHYEMRDAIKHGREMLSTEHDEPNGSPEHGAHEARAKRDQL